MTRNERVTYVVTDKIKDAALQYLAQIEGLFPYMLHLTNKERQRVLKLGPPQHDFVRESQIHAERRPEHLPRWLTVSQFQDKAITSANMREIASALMEMARAIQDTAAVCDEEHLRCGLSHYDSVKSGLRSNIPGTSQVYRSLLRYFKHANSGGELDKLKGNEDPESPSSEDGPASPKQDEA